MDHIRFTKVNIEDRERKKKRGYGAPPPTKYNVEQADFLKNALDAQIKNTLDKSEKFEFQPYLVMKLELEPGYTLQEKDEDKLEYFGVKIINKETKEIQVLFSDDLKLANFKEALENYKKGIIAKTKIQHEDLFSIIKSISGWSREDRVGDNVILEDLNNGDYIDCYLWVFDTVDKSKEKMEEFKKFISANGARTCDTYVGESVVVARVQLNNDILEKILEHPLIYKVENIPKFYIQYQKIKEVKEMSIDDINFDTSNLKPGKSSSICVIDSGIFMQHPLFRGVIGDSKTFYCSDDYIDNSNDYNGHGTAVASICEYGDFQYNDDFVPEIFLFNAKIHDGGYKDTLDLWIKEIKSELGDLSPNINDAILLFCDKEITFEELLSYFQKEQHPYLKMTYSKYTNFYEKLIPNQMQDIVEYFYNGYGCRIYNLSQGDSKYIFNGGKPKAWACVLDELQNKYDIVFVVSTGNFTYELYDDYKNIKETYPNYFYKMKECKLIEPANSASSITVGAISISDEIINSPERLTKLNITRKNEISSITRIGPGVMNAIKPDFIAYGGDRGVEIYFSDRYEPTKNIGISKLLFNNDNEGLFTWNIGTSYAAPYISHILGRILNRYPDASNNLLRCIVASSAAIPEEIIQQVQNVVNSENELGKEFLHQNRNNFNKVLYYSVGYGYPNIDKCLDSFENRVVLIADMKSDDEKIKPDNMHIFEIPLPKEFRQAAGRKRVIISLAFNPPVRNTRLDYIGVSMEYRLIKGVNIDEVIKAYESQKGKDEPFLIDDKYVCSLEPGSNLRSAGTLQKSVYEFSRDINFNNNDNLYLVVNSKMNWSNQPQKYAVVVVLESEDEELRIYNKIKERIEQTITTRIRV